MSVSPFPKFKYSWIFYFFFIFQLSAQSPDIRFLDHLYQTGLHQETIDYLGFLSHSSDTGFYYLGKAYYQQRKLEASIRAFSAISDRHGSWQKEAMFLSSFQSSYLRNFKEAKGFLDRLSIETKLDSALLGHQLMGLALLNRDLNKFDSLSILMVSDQYQVSSYQNKLRENAALIQTFKPRSPVLAGVFSAFLPGAGKIYAGRTGEGIAALLTMSILGFQTREAIRKDGINSVRAILYGSVASVFYVGNIWGSVFSVKVARREFNDQVDDSILLNMHVPLRLVFR
jgi:hypothetical protein